MKVFWLGFGIAAVLAAAGAEDWHRKAVELYPQLAVNDSAFSKKFHALRRQRELADPDFFNNAQWPILLAKECAAQLAPAARPKAAPAKAAPAAAAHSGEKVYLTKCGRCHELPKPRFVEEMTWNRWMLRMRYKANLNDEEYDQLMDYARIEREQHARKAPPKISEFISP
jgi:hypothetical protein